MTEIQDDWPELPLDEVCEVVLGQSPPGSDYNAENVGLPFFQGKAEFGHIFPAAVKWTTTGAKRARPGDVLLSVRAPVGPTNLAPYECVIGRGLVALRPREAIETRYLFWAMRHTAGALAEKATGSTFSAVSGAQVRAHRIRVAPIVEQRRIVEVIEEQFSRLDAADASLRRASQSFRRLTITARSELLSGQWPKVQASQIAEVRLGRQRSPKNHVGPSMRPYLRAANVKWSGLDLSDVKTMQFSRSEADIYELRRGDIVISEASGSQSEVGKAAIWQGEIPGCCFQNTLLRIRPGEKVLSEYLLVVFELAALSGAFGQAAAGVGIHHLGAQKMSSWPVPLPPLNEQRRIIFETERVISVLGHVTAAISAGLQHSRQLRRALLELAFSGRLVSRQSGFDPLSKSDFIVCAKDDGNMEYSAASSRAGETEMSI